MTDRNKRNPAPHVQVIRRQAAPSSPGPAPLASASPTAVPAPVRPVMPAPAPRPAGVAPVPRPVPGPVARPMPRPAPTGAAPGASALPRASYLPTGDAPPLGRPSRGGGFRGPPRVPRPPASAEAIAELARRERVPHRIAKGELEGKMRCRVWKKLHADEAKRFEQAYELVESNPGLNIAEAFGVVQSGLSVADFANRKARVKKHELVKQARASVSSEAVDAFVEALVADKAELSVVLGERSVLDVLTAVEPVSFELERLGPLEKLMVVALARKSTWEQLLPTLERDSRLAQKPLAVSRQPTRRPVSDPRPLLGEVGQELRLALRNGIVLKLPLLAVGAYDVLVGQPGQELLVPLHAMLKWSRANAPAEPGTPPATAPAAAP